MLGTKFFHHVFICFFLFCKFSVSKYFNDRRAVMDSRPGVQSSKVIRTRSITWRSAGCDNFQFLLVK